jgi:peptidoglycan hydrolase-like protein with peptidoglycan-binding domain
VTASLGEQTDHDSAAAQQGRPSSRTRRRSVALLLALVVLAGGIATWRVWLSGGQGKNAAATRIDAGVPTAVLVHRTLTAQTSVGGTLGYADDYTVTGRLAGTVTKLPAPGDVIGQGQPLYEVDDSPVLLLYGTTPPYRALAEGTYADDITGTDVRELNRALVALGYTVGLNLDPSSDEFSWQTKTAVKQLQAAHGMKQTGELSLGQVIFLPGPVRVTQLTATQGGAAAGPVFAATSTTRQITATLAATQQTLVKVGDSVTIILPNNDTIPGRIATVGSVATSDSSGTAKISVTVTPTKPEQTGSLDQAPVQVTITTSTVPNALVIPVTALLALAGGGYAVEIVPAQGAHQLVPVTVGLFDSTQGMVQITGAGLAAGQRVVVPAS